MANRAYNYTVPEGGSSKTRPMEQAASGHHSHTDAIGDLVPANVSSDPRAMPAGNVRPRHSLRGPNGKLRKPGHGGYIATNQTWCHDAFDHSLLFNEKPVVAHMPRDLSAAPSPAEHIAANYGGRPHTHQGTPGYCQRRDCYPQDFRNEVASNGE